MDDDPLRRLGAEVRQRRHAAGLTQPQLVAAAGLAASTRAVLVRLEAGRELPSPEVTAAIDGALAAGGAVKALHLAAAQHRHAEALAARLQIAPSGVSEPTVRGMDTTQDEPALSLHGATEEETTDRRQVLAAGGLTAADVAARISDRIATADPTPLGLAGIAARFQQVTSDYQDGLAPYSQLRGHMEREWLGLEALLDTRISRATRDQLTTYAGFYCYYLGRCALGPGDDDAARAFLTVAGQHAAEVRDPLLAGSVANLAAVAALLWGDLGAALRVATQGQLEHPYTRPGLAAREAVAAARLGDRERTHAALATMEAHLWAGEALPGHSPFDEETAHAFAANALSHLGDGLAAEEHARSSLDLLAGTGRVGNMASNYAALARALLRRRRPEPERAAAAATVALTQNGGRPIRYVVRSAGETWRELSGRWGELPAVRDLGELVVSARKALPAGGVVA